MDANEAEGTEEGDDRSESSETLSSDDAPRRTSSAIERARSANQSAFKSALRSSTSTAILEGRTGEGDGPVILTCDLYVSQEDGPHQHAVRQALLHPLVRGGR